MARGLTEMCSASLLVSALLAVLAVADGAVAQPSASPPSGPSAGSHPAVRHPWLVPALASVRGPCGVTLRPGITLGQHPLQALELYLPDTPNGAAVLVIHGGGWRGGDKSGVGELSGLLASQGFLAAAVNYRLAPEHKWPAQLTDCRLAVNWLKREGSAFGLKAGRIGALGTSAGGHLAAMLALVDGEPRAGAKVAAACTYFGLSDLVLHSVQSTFTRTVLIDLLGAPVERAQDRYREASPVTHVDAGDSPVQICQGGKDTLVPPVQATLLHEALTAKEVPTELVLLEDQGHGFLSKMRRDAKVADCFLRSVAWLRRWLVDGDTLEGIQ